MKVYVMLDTGVIKPCNSITIFDAPFDAKITQDVLRRPPFDDYLPSIIVSSTVSQEHAEKFAAEKFQEWLRNWELPSVQQCSSRNQNY